MAHDIDTTTGTAAIAYMGDTPWHKLGQQMQAGQSIEQWQKAAGMDFDIESGDIYRKERTRTWQWFPTLSR